MAREWVVFGVAGLLAFGCSSTSDNTICPEGHTCDTGKPQGPPHGLRADGTVDITAAEAWPNRGKEPAPLSADELAKACAMLAACSDVDLSKGGTEDSARQLLLAACIQPASSYFWEERAVPTSKKNERWTFEARAILAAGGGCNAVPSASTSRMPEINCEEVGCWWTSKTKPVPLVTCDGAVATLETGSQTVIRDCSHAFAACDLTSATGCSDRAPVACEHPAKDRCDGDIRIGCDGTGRVSFHDCGRVPGGKCVDTGNGLKCVYPDDKACPTATYGACNGSTLKLCVIGVAVDVDCAALGLSGCSAGYCTR